MNSTELESLVNALPGQSEHSDNLRGIIEEKRQIEAQFRQWIDEQCTRMVAEAALEGRDVRDYD